MGKMDSTRTRVTPVFDQLRQKHQGGSDWVLELIRLFDSGKPEENRHLASISASKLVLSGARKRGFFHLENCWSGCSKTSIHRRWNRLCFETRN